MKKLGIVLLLCTMSVLCFEVDKQLNDGHKVEENKKAKELESE